MGCSLEEPFLPLPLPLPLPCASSQPQHLRHRIPPRRLARDPARGVERPLGEEAAVGGGMAQLDPFPLADEMHAVLARDAAAAQGVERDLARGPLPGLTAA